MQKTCPVKFDVECDKTIDCMVPRLLTRCQHLQVDVESHHVFMRNPARVCTVICQRTKQPFTMDELARIVHCTQKEFEEGTCPRAGEPDGEG